MSHHDDNKTSENVSHPNEKFFSFIRVALVMVLFTAIKMLTKTGGIVSFHFIDGETEIWKGCMSDISHTHTFPFLEGPES